MIGEHLWREPKWALAAVYALAGHLAAIILFERERAAKVRAMARGAWHGLLGRPAHPPKVATPELAGATDKI